MAFKLTASEKKELLVLVSALDTAKASLLDRLTELSDDWEEEFHTKTERWQESDSGQKARERINTLEVLADEVEQIDITIDVDELS